ncbi:MAG TPA: secretin N-terminal domain-containing protein, partial [Verrucomicrobiae bacterium]|nr:secretin N-terminal domain-containing protein [Verrucomicrobiae bacterium]
MKTLNLSLLIVTLSWAVSVLAAEPPGTAPKPDAAPTTEATNAAPAAPVPPADLPEPGAVAAAPASGPDAGTNGIHLNFRNAPLSLVLDYLSDAAGFIINKEAEVRGTVDVWSKEPVSKDDAVKLLNSVLRKNGYAVARDGRILTIVSLESAKTSDLPILQGANWQDVEKSDEVVTQIIPVRYANATQLMNNLQVLLPTTASLSVNESANTLILVATKTDIRRMLRIVSALDTSIASIATIKVFPLKYADAKELATVIQTLFAQQSNQQPGGGGFNPRAQFFAMMRGGGPGGQAANNGANAAG